MTDPTALIQPDRGQDAISIQLITKQGFEAFAKGLSAGQRASLAAQKFEGATNAVGIVPDGDGWFAVAGVADPESLGAWCLASLAEKLPEGTYRLSEAEAGAAMFGWALAQYRFARYLSDDKSKAGPRLLLTTQVGRIEPCLAEVAAETLVRDLVNTPAEDMGPAALEAECERLAKVHGAELQVTRGDRLEQEYPMVHAVGRAAARHHAPRIMHLTWGDAAHPVLAVVACTALAPCSCTGSTSDETAPVVLVWSVRLLLPASRCVCATWPAALVWSVRVLLPASSMGPMGTTTPVVLVVGCATLLPTST
jgi:leucyl aminopeptidase